MSIMMHFPDKMTEEKEAGKQTFLNWFRRNRFYATTPIGGFGLINISKFKWEIITWYIVLIIFAGLTIQNAHEVIIEYLDNPTVTSVQAVDTSMGTVNFSVDSFYVEIKAPVLNLVFDSIFENPDGLTMDDAGEIVRNPLYFAKAREFLRKKIKTTIETFDTTEKLLNQNWNPEMILMMQLSYGCLYNTYDTFCSRMRSRNFYEKEMETFETQLTQMNITNDQLFSKFYTELFQFAGVSYKIVTQKRNNLLDWQPLEKSSSDHELILQSFEGVDGVGKISKLKFYLHLKTDIESFHLKWSLPERKLNYLDENYFFDKSSLTVISSDEQKQFTAKPNTKVTVYEQISEIFESKTTRCHPYSDNQRCKRGCQNMVTYQQCKCILPREQTFILKNSQTPSAICQLNEYLKSSCPKMDKIENNDQYKDCVRNCSSVPPCNRRFYTYTMREGDTFLRDDKCDNCAIIVMDHADYNYTFFHYEQSKRTSFPAFLAQLGGVFDLWIGASAIALIHVFVYIFKQIIYACNRKTKTGRRLREMFGTSQLENTLIAPTGIALGTGTVGMEDEEFKSQIGKFRAHVVGEKYFDKKTFLRLIDLMEKKIETMDRTIEKQENEIKNLSS